MDMPVSRSLLTPLKFIQRTAAVYPDKTAVVYGARQFSYAELGERVNRLAWALRSIGLNRNDRVAYLCPNIPPMLEAHFGVPLAGGVLVAINIRLSPQEIAYILNHSGARILLVDSELAHLIRPIRGQLNSVERIVNIIDSVTKSQDPLEGDEYESLLAGADAGPVPCWLNDEEETISINYTSGTTGRPKGVMYSHRGAYLNALGEIIELEMTADSVFLWTLPMFHCNGWCVTWAMTAVGGRHVCMRKVEPSAVWSLIENERVSHINGAPVVMTGLINDPTRPSRLARPLTVTMGGAPPSPTLIEQLETLGARIIHLYGLTETYGPHTLCAYQESWPRIDVSRRARLLARQGVSYLATDPVRVVDQAMNDVPADGQTMGEVVMQGNNVMKGYYNDPDATTQAFRGGWFHSGDLAVMHPDGYIELRDRSKDIIISGGENISSIEVEQAILRHTGVREVAVIGIPHDKWGESPKAFVTLKDGQTATADDIIQFCRDNLAHFKCPTCIEFTDLPKTSTGKIQKMVLREKEWSGHEKRIRG